MPKGLRQQPSARSQGMATLSAPISPLLPLQVLVFALIHVAYFFFLKIGQLIGAAQRSRRSRQLQRQVGNGAEGLAATDQPHKIPKHLALILTPPRSSVWSSIFDYLVARPFSRLYTTAEASVVRQREASERRSNQAAQKAASDLSQGIKLAAGCGVKTLTVYTRQPLASHVLVSAERLLRQDGCIIEGAGDGLVPSQVSEQLSSKVSEKTGSDTCRSSSDDGESVSTGGSSRSEDGTLHSSNTSVAGDMAEEGVTQTDSKTSQLRVRLITSGVERMRWNREAASTNASAALEQGQRQIDVFLISEDDGKLEMARSATLWARLTGREFRRRLKAMPAEAAATGEETDAGQTDARQCRKQMVAALTPDRFNRHLLEQGTIPEPDFLIVFGAASRAPSLHGFPPWAIRLTEFFFDTRPSPTRAGFDDALRYFSKTEHRYGR